MSIFCGVVFVWFIICSLVSQFSGCWLSMNAFVCSFMYSCVKVQFGVLYSHSRFPALS